MGQYHKIVNLDKREFINPHQMGAGLKLWEQLANHPGSVACLIPLLAVSNGRGGGDFADDAPNAKLIIGRWAGDRLAILGDYAEDTDLPAGLDPHPATIYDRCPTYDDSEPSDDGPLYQDISYLLKPFLCETLGGHYEGEKDAWQSFVRNS